MLNLWSLLKKTRFKTIEQDHLNSWQAQFMSNLKINKTWQKQLPSLSPKQMYMKIYTKP